MDKILAESSKSSSNLSMYRHNGSEFNRAPPGRSILIMKACVRIEKKNIKVVYN